LLRKETDSVKAREVERKDREKTRERRRGREREGVKDRKRK
jgi:hypothetical protein